MSRIVIAHVNLNQILFGAVFSLPSQLDRCTKKLEEKLSLLAGTCFGFLSVKTSRKKLSHLAGKLSSFEPKNILRLLAGRTLRF